MAKWRKWVYGAVFALALIAALALLPGIRQNVRQGGREAVREAVLRSAVECYTVEGAYPENLDYLIQNYGLTVNQDNYIIVYEVFASNQLPEVQVLVQGESKG